MTVDLSAPARLDRRSWSIRKPLGIGLLAMAAFAGLGVAWGSTLSISGAVIAKGQVEVSSSQTAVQHPVGGVIAEILATNGDKVKSGDVLLRLDDTQLRSDLAAIEGELFEILANEARLLAEVDNETTLSPHPLLARAAKGDSALVALIQRQQRQLDEHYLSLATEIELIEEQTRQVGNQVVGEEAELDAKRQQLELLESELSVSSQSLKRGIITSNIVTTLQKEIITAKGEIGRLTARIAELRGKIAEQELKAHAIPQEAREKSADGINLLGQQKQRLLESRNALLYKLANLEVRAPISGTVHDMRILGLRSVVEAAKPILYIVPNDEPAIVIVRVDASDIDQLSVGQQATMRFTAFNRRSTPMVAGELTNVSADAFTDERTQRFYYLAEVHLPAEQVRTLGDVTLRSGMPVEAYFATTSRSPASYFIKPIADYFDRAFRD